ncbi:MULTISPECIES: spore coat protein CotJB [Heyndrickxia]|jgi:spore coat protein JB|uniref:Spore coat protein CotJB n=1 Tax=Heyndrickxia oleronia TaxID=38875 RepID=A0A8E2I5M8_9BACI|nr:spore coat protein CotJB [Heyndrickxia oleronia]NYV66067.1 spore coat protein CotJB [Bacillus sp. Gen3]OJH18709.1 spore coat protein CotJB [Bacillus obstructivus]MBU5213681.1 spore coat protein CotJB [Heyndrickxia oleronia]MCI1592090.1 spore coat protein CotJB [Heyndrickxia oleronia]MCI1612256.1 spore coat protein CotJB [Heyndrickxia oleronia]
MKQVPPEYYQKLEELQAIDFVIVELTLYLDTHPKDQDAVQQYNQFVHHRKKLKKEFEKLFGPLTNFGYSYSDYPWNWKDAPWPWQV